MRLFSVVLILAALALAGCGSSSSSSSTGSSPSGTTAAASSGAAAETAKFILHAGLAFGAFHRYIYKPLKSGDLKNPLSHKLTALKAAAAAAFMVHEIKLAGEAAKGSPTLSKLVVPLSALGAGVASVVAAAKSGNVNTSELDAGNSAIESIKSEASGAGASILEKAPSLP